MHKNLHIYINGTDESNISGLVDSLANVLHNSTIQNSDYSESFCLKGCAVDNPYWRDLGAVFAHNLTRQIDDLNKTIRSVLKTHTLTLYMYGFSRGAAGVFLLCKRLRDVPTDNLTINVSALEPVTGNFINAARLDYCFKTYTTLSARIKDLTDCYNIKNAQVLFTNVPIPSIICHSPLLPDLPKDCYKEIEVLPGIHKTAEQFFLGAPHNEETTLASHHIASFLQRTGACLQSGRLRRLRIGLTAEKILEYETQQYIKTIYDRLLNQHINQSYDCLPSLTTHNQACKRPMHDNNAIRTKKTASYVNLYHKYLSVQAVESTEDALFTVDKRCPLSSSPINNHYGSNKPVNDQLTYDRDENPRSLHYT